MSVLYDVQCDQCFTAKEVYSEPELIDNLMLNCQCGGVMRLAWLPNHRRPFPSFVTNNLKTYNNGQPMEITSLHQIRQLEKKYADRELRWEPGSFDNYHYGEE